MKRNLNKAFTLIELLAVIVILAIIALIATPIILGIVEDARKDSFERSVELVISTTDLDVASKNIQDGYTYEITDGTIPELEIGIKNIEGMNGTIVYDKEGKEQYAIHNGQYCVMKTEGMDKAVISDYEEGSCKLVIPTDSKYFTYKEIEPIYKIIDKDACQTFFVEEWRNTSEDATTICNNEPYFNGMPLTEAILDGYFDIIDVIYLINVGAISYTGPEYEIADKDACIDVHMNEWNFSEEEAIVGCSPSSFTLIEHINLASEIGEEYFNIDCEYNDMLDAGAIVKNGSGKYELTNSCSTFLIQEWGYSELMANYYCNDGIWYSALTDDLKIFPLDEPGLLALKDSGAIRVTNAPLEITDYSEDGPKNVIIPSTIDGNKVVSIGAYAFQEKNITSVTMPDTVMFISRGAFKLNNLTIIKIPDSVTSIGKAAFASNQITTIEISNNNRLKTVEREAFGDNLVSETSEGYQTIYQLNASAFEAGK